jgi:hypothetical protein
MDSRLIKGTIMWGPYVVCSDVRSYCLYFPLKIYTKMSGTSQNGDVLADDVHLHYGHVGPTTHTICLGQQSLSGISGIAETEEKQN